MEREECKALAVEVTPVTMEGLLTWIGDCVDKGPRGEILAGHNLHSVYLYHIDERFRNFYEQADVVLADGAPILWDYLLSGGRSPISRIGSTDWIPKLDAVSGLERVMVVGASESSNRRFVAWLSNLLPKACVDGIPGYEWSHKKASIALERIKQARPQLILIGLGMPRQEEFALDVNDASYGCLIATVGGALDQLSGVQNNAPRWIGHVGLEWAWRLASQPKRLAGRYLVEPWKLLFLRIRSIVPGKGCDPEEGCSGVI